MMHRCTLSMLMTHFVDCNDYQHASHILKIFSVANANIRFTVEHERDNVLHFLDLGMKRNTNSRLERNIYRKDTWSGLCSNFDSF